MHFSLIFIILGVTVIAEATEGPPKGIHFVDILWAPIMVNFVSCDQSVQKAHWQMIDILKNYSEHDEKWEARNSSSVVSGKKIDLIDTKITDTLFIRLQSMIILIPSFGQGGFL